MHLQLSEDYETVHGVNEILGVLTTKEENKLNVFEMRCLRSIIGVSRRDRIRNIDIRRTTQSENIIIEVIKIERMKRFGHKCRKQNTSLVYQSKMLQIRDQE